jgi:DNA repair protein RecO (recombination protein O)
VANLRDEGICVRHWDWSETSQTVSLLTREHGLVRGLAKGSRREKGSFSGGIELLTCAEVLALSKPRSDLLTLTSWDLREPFRGLRSSLPAFHAGMYLADLVLCMISDHDPHPQVFESLHGVLGLLSRDSAHARSPLGLVLGFQWAILSETGTNPDLDSDIRSGGPMVEGDVLAFVPGHGGFTRDGDAGWRVRRETVELLRLVRKGDGPNPIGGAQADACVERAVRLLGAYVDHLTGRGSRTLSPLLRVVDTGMNAD